MGVVFRRHRSELPDRPRVDGPCAAPAEGRAIRDEDGRTVMWQFDCGGRRAEELWHRRAEKFSSTGLWPNGLTLLCWARRFLTRYSRKSALAFVYRRGIAPRPSGWS